MENVLRRHHGVPWEIVKKGKEDKQSATKNQMNDSWWQRKGQKERSPATYMSRRERASGHISLTAS